MFNKLKTKIKNCEAYLVEKSNQIALLQNDVEGLKSAIAFICSSDFNKDLQLGVQVKEGYHSRPQFTGYGYMETVSDHGWWVINRTLKYSYGSPFTEERIKFFYKKEDAEKYCEGYKLTSQFKD